MKKKIKLGELTLREYKRLCYEYYGRDECQGCPLYNVNIRCYEKFVDDEELDEEVEIDEKEA